LNAKQRKELEALLAQVHRREADAERQRVAAEKERGTLQAKLEAQSRFESELRQKEEAAERERERLLQQQREQREREERRALEFSEEKRSWRAELEESRRVIERLRAEVAERQRAYDELKAANVTSRAASDALQEAKSHLQTALRQPARIFTTVVACSLFGTLVQLPAQALSHLAAARAQSKPSMGWPGRPLPFKLNLPVKLPT